MFAGANVQYVFQNGVLPDVTTPLGILLENAHTDRVKTLQQQQESGCDLEKSVYNGICSQIKNKQN